MKNFKNKYLFSIIFSLIAFFISSYLTILHFQNTIPPCTFSGCEVVLTSQYAQILGIPVSLLGAIFYGSILALSVSLFSNFKISIFRIYLIVISVGILVSSYFLFLQIVVIKEFCQYCLVTELCTLILFTIGVSEIKRLKVKE